MVNSNAMAILFPNFYDKMVPELVSERLTASIPFASRYRMIDFILSSLVNCDITNIAVLVRENYFSLLDHLGSGREWDLTRKNGGLNIFPPYAEKTMGRYDGRVDAIFGILQFLRQQKEKYIVMADTNIAANINFKKVIDFHEANEADVTILYGKETLPESVTHSDNANKGFYYTFDVGEDQRIEDIHINSNAAGVQNFGMNVYIMNRESLIEWIKEACMNGGIYFERDILLPNVKKLRIMGYEYVDYYARITDMKRYFDENMRLLEDENLDELFAKSPIHTKIRDDNPTRYIGNAHGTNVMVADGCVIEGEIENAILFRGVKIGKGAKVKNCILMQDTVVEDGASLEYIITDKQVTVTEGKVMKGTDTFPFYIAKKHTV